MFMEAGSASAKENFEYFLDTNVTNLAFLLYFRRDYSPCVFAKTTSFIISSKQNNFSGVLCGYTNMFLVPEKL